MTPSAPLPGSLETLQRCVTDILLNMAGNYRGEADRLDRFAAMASQASSAKEITTIIDAAARGQQAGTMTVQPDWQARAVWLLGFAEEDTAPDNWGCCADIEPCPKHADRFAVSGFLGRIRAAVKDAPSPEDAAMLFAEIIAGGGGR